MKSAGILSTLGVGIFAVLLVFFLVQPYSTEITANRLSFYWSLFIPDVIVGGWLSIPNDWRAPETVKTFFDSFNTSILPLNQLSVLFIAAIESLWIYSLGSLIFRVLKNPLEESPLLRFCLTCAAGAAALSALTGILGLLGCLQTWLFWTLATGAILTFLWGIVRKIRNSELGIRNYFTRNSQLFRELKPTATNIEPLRGSSGSASRLLSIAYCLLPIALIALLSLLAVLPAMSPPWEFDVREYHLESVKEFWLSGRITALPNNAYANMPLGAESLVLTAMSLSGDWFLGALAGKTVLSLFVPLTALLLFTLGEKYLSKRAGLIAALIYVSAPLVVRNAQFGLIDNVLAAYALATAAIVSLEFGIRNSELREAPQLSSATLAGFMVGMAAAIKYPGVLFVALPCFAVIVWKNSRARLWLPIVILLLSAALVGGIWYLKNAILLGNPVYPLCSSLFGSEFPAGFSAESYARWQTVHAPHGWSWSAIFTPITNFFFSSMDASPLLLPTLICCIMFWKQLPKLARWSLIYCGLFLVGWLVTTHRIERFLLPIVPFVAFAGGAAFDALLSDCSIWKSRIFKGVLALGVVYSCLILAFPLPGGMLGSLKNVSVMRSVPMRLGEGMTQLVSLKSKELLKTKNTDERVLLLGDAAVFDWPLPIEYAVCFNSDVFLDSVTTELQGANPPKAIVVNLSEIARYQRTEYGYSSKIKAVLELLESSDRFTPIYRSENVIIYERVE